MNGPVRIKSNCLGAVTRRLRFAFIPPASWEISALRSDLRDCAVI